MQIKNLEKKIKQTLASLALAGTILTTTNCATSFSTRHKSFEEQSPEEFIDYAVEVLNAPSKDWLKVWPGGYISLKSSTSDIYLLAGLYAGTVKVTKENGRIKLDGFYSRTSNPEVLYNVLRDADKNKDRVITPEEINQKLLDIERFSKYQHR